MRPFVDFKAVYDDNVFVQNGDREEDIYMIVSPGLLLQLGRDEQRRLELEYRADIFRYLDTDEANDAEDHNIRFTANIYQDRGFNLKVNELASRAHEPRSQQNLFITPELNKFWSNDFDMEIGYAFPHFKVAVGYQNFYVDFNQPSSAFRDRMDNAGKLAIYYKMFPKTSLLIQGVYRNVDHYHDDFVSESLDSDEYWAMAGLTWEMTAKSKGTIKGGYEWKRFKEDGRRDFEKPVFQVSIEHNFTPKSAIVINGVRQANETDDPLVRYYMTTGGNAAIMFRPVTKVLISPFGSYTQNRYAGETVLDGIAARRIDDVWTAGINIKYDLNKWISIAIGYQHTKRISTITFYDYTDNMGFVSIKGML